MGCPGESSGLIAVTTGAAVSNVKQGVLLGMTVTNGTVTLYDGASTAGRLIAKVVAPSTSTVPLYIENGIGFMNSLFIVVTGVSAEAVVYFERIQ